MRSDSDSNTYNTFSTPSTLCSESERKNDGCPLPRRYGDHGEKRRAIVKNQNWIKKSKSLDFLRVLRISVVKNSLGVGL